MIDSRKFVAVQSLMCYVMQFTEEGLWVHLNTTIVDYLRPIALREEDGTVRCFEQFINKYTIEKYHKSHMIFTKNLQLHVAIQERSMTLERSMAQERFIPASLQIQHMPSSTDESEVIFWRKGNWRGKRYFLRNRIGGHHDLLPCAVDPIVEFPGPKKRKGRKPRPTISETNRFSELLTCHPCNANGTIPPWPGKMRPKKKRRRRSQTKDTAVVQEFNVYPPPMRYYEYDDIVPLEQAIRRQLAFDPLPTRQYLHLTSYQPITIGEWMLCIGRHSPDRAPLDYSWIRLLEKRVSRFAQAKVR